MVDAALPYKIDRRLSVLFLDLNSYFASCEQQEHPELRGLPIVVAPVETDSTCAIAASYEAKRFGIKTGTNIGEARKMCPGLRVVSATPRLYIQYHERILETVETVLPIDKVCSVDEMRFRLIGVEREPARATELALRLKKAIREGIGECMTCSVGVAPNSFLAKLATEMQKPDGLVVLQSDDLPDRVRHLKLTDFTGINRKMQARLQAAGIFDVPALYAASPAELKVAFGSIVGERWWYLIRGYQAEIADTERKSLSHSHVLPPNLRHDEGCRQVLLRLIQKATARLRSENLCATAVWFNVSGFSKGWKAHARLAATADTVTINEAFLQLWKDRSFSRPRSVGVAFTGLYPTQVATPSLFDNGRARDLLNVAIDDVNKRFGKNSIFLAAMSDAKDTASEKIAFQKTKLFSEGLSDN